MLSNQLLWLNSPKLKMISQPVTAFDASLQTLVDKMFAMIASLHDSSLAAIQMGVPLKVIVFDLPLDNDTHFKQAMINPDIIHRSKETQLYTEYCSSIPQHEFQMERASAVTVAYQTVTGELKEISAEGVFAVCLQHEIDHLNGVLISDQLSSLKLSRLKQQLIKLKKQ